MIESPLAAVYADAAYNNALLLRQYAIAGQAAGGTCRTAADASRSVSDPAALDLACAGYRDAMIDFMSFSRFPTGLFHASYRCVR